MAAEASKDKADKLMKLAKAKVKSIISNYKELDSNLQAEMEELEGILLNTKINANFDPESQEDIDWVAGEIEKILLDTPQLKTLEKKLNMTDDINDSLDAALNGLKKVTDVTKMVP